MVDGKLGGVENNIQRGGVHSWGAERVHKNFTPPSLNNYLVRPWLTEVNIYFNRFSFSYVSFPHIKIKIKNIFKMFR